jgi:hypothetical protein
MESPTPSPRRVRTKRNRPRRQEQREPGVVDNDTANLQSEPSSEDELFDLLGITPAAHEKKALPLVAAPEPTGRGLLAISKEDIAESKKGRRGKKDSAFAFEGVEKRSEQSRQKQPEEGVIEGKRDLEKGSVPGGPDAHPLPAKPIVKAHRTRTKRTTTPKDGSDPSDIAASRGSNTPRQAPAGSSVIPGATGAGTPSFDMSMLSQSLPSLNGDLLERSMKQSNGKPRNKDAPAAWDMPETKGTQALTASLLF